MKFTNFDRFLVIVIIMLLTVIIIQNSKTSITPAFAYQNSEQVAFPIKISNIDELAGGGGVSGFSTDDQGRFVVIDGVNHKMMFCEVVWNGASASLMVRDTKEF